MEIVGFYRGSTISQAAAADITFLPSATYVAGTPNTATKVAAVNKRLTADMEVYLRYTPTGTTPSAGDTTALLEFYSRADQGL
jgi:hypothetical protein